MRSYTVKNHIGLEVSLSFGTHTSDNGLNFFVQLITLFLVTLKKKRLAEPGPAVHRPFPPPPTIFFIAFLAELGNLESF